MQLYGVYTSHTPEPGPVNNRKTAEPLLAFADSDISSGAGRYKVNRVLAQYHSALEHTFLWVVDAEDPNLMEQFCIETAIASFDYVKTVPLITFDEGVIPLIRKIHDL